MASISFGRREALRLVAGSAVGGSLAGCEWLLPPIGAPTPAEDPSLSAIDVHCHVFNARDLPIEGFIERVVLHDHEGFGWQDLVEPLIGLIAQIMKDKAITAVQEARDIRAAQRRRESAAPLDDDLLRQSVINAVRAIRTEGPARAAALSPRRARCLVPPDGVRSLRDPAAQMDELLRTLAAGGRRQTALSRSAEPAPAPEAVADGVVRGDQQIKGILLLATLLTRPRAELVHRLVTLPAAGGAEIRLLAPALIDFSFWLEDHSATPLAEQIDVMSAISANRGGGNYAVHGWVSFCPWRQAHEEHQGRSEQFELVKDAILTKGFLGVKIYPVMGFFPLGNKGQPFPGCDPGIPDFGGALDRALTKLYAWCVGHDVPILAHCSYSQFPAADAGKRGAPQNWLRVLKRAGLKDLRLNFAHYGGLWRLYPSPGNPDLGWTRTATEIMHRRDFPNVYADVADHEAVLFPDSARHKGVTQALARLLADNPRAKDRLMYGTDFAFLMRAPGAGAYYPNMKKHFAPEIGLSDTQRSGFLGGNAARFLGLAPENGVALKSRERLEAFYRRNKLDRTILDRFGKIAKDTV